MGENGAGKTTLLKMVMEMEGHDPTKGTRTSHRNLKFGYFTQHFVDQLDMTVCPVEIMQKEFPGFKVKESFVKTASDRFLFVLVIKSNTGGGLPTNVGPVWGDRGHGCSTS